MGPVETRSVVSRSPEETHALGAGLGGLLEVGHFVGLVGDLGAGKTAFIRGVADGAAVPRSEVSSPTFAIVAPYRGRIPIHHADFYRLADEDELYATGFFDLVPQGATLVEWLDRLPRAAPEDEHLTLTLAVQPDESRMIRAEAFGPRHARLLQAWRPERP